MSDDLFIAEQGEVAESTDAGPLLSTRDLLLVLGVHRASDDRKRVAVDAWLRATIPTLLRGALERSGYLPPTMLQPEPPRDFGLQMVCKSAGLESCGGGQIR